MMDIPIRYEASFFSDMTDVAPTAETIKSAMDLFGNEGLLPNALPQVELATGKMRPLLRLSSPDRPQKIDFAPDRVTVYETILEPNQAPPDSVENFAQHVSDYWGRIIDKYPRKAHRLSFIIDGLLPEISNQEMERAYSALVNPLQFYIDAPPFEWSVRSVSSIRRPIGGSNEKLNVIATIKRMSGSLTTTEETIKFDRVGLATDINTSHDSKESRLSIEAAQEFCTIALSIRNGIVHQFEEWINAKKD